MRFHVVHEWVTRQSILVDFVGFGRSFCCGGVDTGGFVDVEDSAGDVDFGVFVGFFEFGVAGCESVHALLLQEGKCVRNRTMYP